MDDPNSHVQQPVVQTPQQTDPTVQPMQPVSQVPTPQPSSPISGGNKEYGPIGRVSEFVTPNHTEVAPSLPQEVREAGVQEVAASEQPTISEEAKQAGVKPAKESVPVTLQDTQGADSSSTPLPTPMNYQQALQEIHHGNPTNSKTWLSMLSKYVLEKFGMQKAS